MYNYYIIYNFLFKIPQISEYVAAKDGIHPTSELVLQQLARVSAEVSFILLAGRHIQYSIHDKTLNSI